MKKITAILLALVLVLAMSTSAFATTADETGTITVSGTLSGQTYSIYRIFDLYSYSGTNYAYLVNADWAGFFAEEKTEGDVTTPAGAGLSYVSIDENGTITWIEGADAQAFAKAALTYAKDNNIAAVVSKEASGTTVEFTGLDLGYYLLDSSLGALCALDTTATDVTVYEKNSYPSIEKKVYEDSQSDWFEVADADIGQVVNFKLEVNTGSTTNADGDDYPESTDDTENLGTGLDDDYEITDTLVAGMTVVNVDGTEVAENAQPTIEVSSDKKDAWAVGTDYTVSYENNVLEITLLKTGALAAEEQNADIVIEYAAKLNDGATIAGVGNKNTVDLEYNNYTTPAEHAIVYTWQVDVSKYYDNAGVNTPLAGAKFVLKNSDGSYYQYNDGKVSWVALDDATVLVTNDEGKLCLEVTTTVEGEDGETTTTTLVEHTFKGLDSGSYKMVETEAPAGYNKLTSEISVNISAFADDTEGTRYGTEDGAVLIHVVNGEAIGEDDDTFAVEVENKTGTELPSTGGMGTTLFYVVGGMMMAAAVVLLVAKKKVSAK